MPVNSEFTQDADVLVDPSAVNWIMEQYALDGIGVAGRLSLSDDRWRVRDRVDNRVPSCSKFFAELAVLVVCKYVGQRRCFSGSVGDLLNRECMLVNHRY